MNPRGTARCCSPLCTCPVFCGTWRKRPANEAVRYGACFGRSHCGLMRATNVQKGTDNVKSWETIADNLTRAGFSWGCSSEIDSTGRVIFTADAYSRDGRRFTVLADERLTAFLELQAAIQRTRKTPMKYWELIADNLNKGGWSLGWVSALDREWRTICIVDAHRDDGKRFVACADEKLTAFLELESATRPTTLACSVRGSFAISQSLPQLPRR
jgi:hypothetical protein